MSIKQAAKRYVGNLRRRIRNAARGFVVGEASYHLSIGEFGEFTVAYRQGTADEYVLADSFDNDILFPEMSDYKPQPDDIIVDVGAHIGTFSLLAASKVADGRVFAIEASHETYNYLRVNVALNKANNITPVHLALASEPGVSMLYHDRGGNWGHSIMKRLSTTGEQVATNSLRNFCEQHQIARIALMKFNCEGAEFPILLSTPFEYLRRIRMMLVLYHLDLVTNHTRENLMDHLHAAGFSTVIRNESPLRGWIWAVSVLRDDPHGLT